MGMHLLAVCDVAIRPNSSDRHRQKENVSYDAETQKIIAGGSSVICFDNYNHAFGSAAIKLNRKTNMLLMNMIVCGLSIMSHHVDQDFRIDVDGIEQSSIPTTKLILKDYLEPMITKVEDTLDNLNHEVSSPFAYYELSRVVEEKIQTVPLASKRKRERMLMNVIVSV